MSDKVSVILSGLNSEQEKAVKCVEGPVLIVAGAGSGKTRVLTGRIAYLLEKGVDPRGILALTFTKKAAGEMKERVALMVGDAKARRLVMGTFHSVFIRFLREYAGKIGYCDQFTIYDQSDSVSAVKTCIRELELDEKIYKPKEIQSRISMAKNNLVTAQAYRANNDLRLSDSHCKRPKIAEIYELYDRKCRNSSVMDFDDILLNMNILLRDNPDVCREISERFTHILVDEYQDTNRAQYIILKKLAQTHHNICVVGDDSQSIYAFRGAKIQNILDFRKDYPECSIFRLEQNYRSTPNIVDAANSLISNNEGRIPKQCFAVGDPGEKLRIIKSYTEQEEAICIVSDMMDRMRSERAQYQDFSVLYRTNSQSRALEEALRRRNIPYAVYSGNSFFDRAEVKDMMAYFKLSVNPNDDESFKRIIGKPSRGIGDTSVSALGECARAGGLSLFKAAYSEDLVSFGLKPATIRKIREFCNMIDGFARLVATENANDLSGRIAEQSGLYAYYKQDTSIEGMSRTSNVEELLNSVAQYVEEREGDEGVGVFVPLSEFIENVTLLSNADVSEEDTNNKVALMTVHSAKGLEFPYVYVAGLEENLFPSAGMLLSKFDIEEERRLFYVAITRAMRAVTLSFANSRMRNGKHESNMPSRFIREIDARYIENPLSDDDYDSSDEGMRSNSAGDFGFYKFGGSGKVKFFHKRPAVSLPEKRTSKPPAAFSDSEAVPMTELYEGERIEHNRFGAGKILEIMGKVPELKARVLFDSYGEKMLLLKYAKIRPEKS